MKPEPEWWDCGTADSPRPREQRAAPTQESGRQNRRHRQGLLRSGPTEIRFHVKARSRFKCPRAVCSLAGSTCGTVTLGKHCARVSECRKDAQSRTLRYRRHTYSKT